MIPLEGPFVLLDDARADGASPARLYTDPVATLTAQNGDELEALLVALRQAQQDGLHVAGFFNYGAGAHFLPNLSPVAAELQPEPESNNGEEAKSPQELRRQLSSEEV